MSLPALSEADERFMRRAIQLAERGLGETNPNPAVGCVLVHEGRVVGEGFHESAGLAHAEARALDEAGGRARGATAYVTLEPCAPSRTKRTPPCAPRLIDAGVKRVVFGVQDFNPNVKDAGARLLRDVGVVVEGSNRGDAQRLAQHFNLAMRRRRPFITLKAGMTLDGRIATAAGESRWITSPRQRAAARALRRLFDGVVVGIETALHDDPLLLPTPRTKRPFARVVLDSRLRLPLDSRLVATAGQSPLIVICTEPNERRQKRLEERDAIVVAAPGAAGRVSIQKAMNALFTRGFTSLMVEGGSEVMGSFVREQCFDELVIFRASLLLGGRGSRPVVGGPDPSRLAQAVPMRRARPDDSATLRYGLPGESALEVEVYEPRRSRRGDSPRPGEES